MENYNTNTNNKKKKQAHPMKKIGKSIKDTFIEMSSSLAGWIEDTGDQLMGKKSTKKTPKATNATQSKSTTSQPKSNA